MVAKQILQLYRIQSLSLLATQTYLLRLLLRLNLFNNTSCSVCTNLSKVHDLGVIEPQRNDCIATPRHAFSNQPFHGMVSRSVEHSREVLELTTNRRL